jgi:hypothetical protein
MDVHDETIDDLSGEGIAIRNGTAHEKGYQPDSLGHSLIKCLMSFVGEHRRVVAHFDQAHFNQSLQITWTDGR